MAFVPLQPRLTWLQNRSRPTPNGETTPMPVMTMREAADWGMNRTYTKANADTSRGCLRGLAVQYS